MEFWRNAEEDLQQWRSSKYRKPLVIRGARQTGKTTLARRFGRTFDTYIELNLETERDRALFDNDLTVSDLLQYICLAKGLVRRGETLLFLDEIQYSPRAVMLMRYFHEELPDLYVISAGSLLEIMMEKQKISFPVGRVEYLYLLPWNTIWKCRYLPLPTTNFLSCFAFMHLLVACRKLSADMWKQGICPACPMYMPHC